jgi:hypothetical protein
MRMWTVVLMLASYLGIVITIGAGLLGLLFSFTAKTRRVKWKSLNSAGRANVILFCMGGLFLLISQVAKDIKDRKSETDQLSAQAEVLRRHSEVLSNLERTVYPLTNLQVSYQVQLPVTSYKLYSQGTWEEIGPQGLEVEDKDITKQLLQDHPELRDLYCDISFRAEKQLAGLRTYAIDTIVKYGVGRLVILPDQSKPERISLLITQTVRVRSKAVTVASLRDLCGLQVTCELHEGGSEAQVRDHDGKTELMSMWAVQEHMPAHVQLVKVQICETRTLNGFEVTERPKVPKVDDPQLSSSLRDWISTHQAAQGVYAVTGQVPALSEWSPVY